MKDNFPSILDLLTQTQREEISFVYPTVGFGITERCTSDSASSPAAKDGSIRNLKLGAKQAIPFHQQEMEKIYLYKGGGHVDVFVLYNGIKYKYALDAEGDILVIPKGCPHAVLYTGMLPVEITVITYPRLNPDPKTKWEPATEKLIKNEHLYSAD